MKHILITGAAAGIGQATARLFHKYGWRVGLIDINEVALAGLAHELGVRCWHRAVDVSDYLAVQKALGDFTADYEGRLDVLFNSAGVLKMGRFEDLSPAEHEKTFAINVTGLMNITHAAFPLLRETPGARVINMSSASALHGVPFLGSYSASKFAVRGLTEALNIEWRRHDITVLDIMPPFVNTGMVTGQAFRPPVVERMGVKLEAEDVAEAVWGATTTDQVHVPVGLPFRLTVLLESLMPRRFTRFLMGWLSRD
jgi:NAD(P)-dependent dehydrogenase (short-subunit alcohol dehydrogenase family)